MSARENGVARPATPLREIKAKSEQLDAELATIATEAKSTLAFEKGASGPVRRYLRQRRRREQSFPDGIFADPAWEILLDLHASELEKRRTTVSDACVASGVPYTTAIRWIARLVGDGLISRTQAENDGRRIYLSLLPDTRIKLADWMIATFE